MKKLVTDTIVATATPPGRGGVAIIRISGPLVPSLIEPLVKKETLSPRTASMCQFFDEKGQALDEGIALFFPNPHSFTGEDVLEFHGHGSPAIIDCLLRRMIGLGVRLARPGEFSERAFLNDKIDLVQAEAIADLIDASSEQAARASFRSLQGDFSKRIYAAVDSLIHLRTYVEAAIDFVDEEIDFLTQGDVSTKLKTILKELNQVKRSAIQGSLLREGINVVIAGEPNVGKSSLLNQLSGKETAIVTDIAGTTRDVLRESITLDGMPIHIIDTAGLRESHDPVEQEGIKRAKYEIKQADLVLHIVDARESMDKPVFEEMDSIKKIIVRNKIDLTSEIPELKQQSGVTIIALSAKTSAGVDLLRDAIKQYVGFEQTNEGTFSARRRHLDAVEQAKEFVSNGIRQWESNQFAELLAEDLRQAQLALDEITGKFTSDDLLGRIFSSFCIGK